MKRCHDTPPPRSPTSFAAPKMVAGPVTVGTRARIGAGAIVTDDVPEGATMIGLKARSTLIPAETWLKEFIPYGTPCEEPCADGNGTERIQQLEFELGLLRAEIEALKERAPGEGVAPEPAARKRSAKR